MEVLIVVVVVLFDIAWLAAIVCESRGEGAMISAVADKVVTAV